jgi:hypothetical protein
MPKSSRSYHRAKLGFRYNYEMENPLTKLKGNINFLKEILKEHRAGSDKVTRLLRMGKEAPEKLGAHREELFLLKLEMEKQVSEGEVESGQEL